MKKKELIEKIKKLELRELHNHDLETINKRIDTVIEMYDDLRLTLDFVLEYGIDTVVFDKIPFGLTLTYYCFNIRYIYNKELCYINKVLLSGDVNIIKNDKEFTTIKCINTNKDGIDTIKYHMLDKAKRTILEIPKPAFVLEQELAENKETMKKDDNTAKTETSKKTKNAKS